MSIEFGVWESPETVNPYLDTVKAMIENGNPDIAATVTVKESDALKTRTLFARAANAYGKTARIRVKDEPVKDAKGKPTGDVRNVFTLTARHKARRGPSNESVARTSE